MKFVLDYLFDKIDEICEEKAFYMGLAFKFDKGIAIIDYHLNDSGDEIGYILDWVSYQDNEQPASVKCSDMEELKAAIAEFAL